jgi:DNA-directed RNA polymerase alpha subunit
MKARDMTLLEHYAGLAMQGMLSNPKIQEQIPFVDGQPLIEEIAWKIAAAMVKTKEISLPEYHKHLRECSELSNRTRNALLAQEVETVGQLLAYPTEQFSKIPNLGKVGRAEVFDLLVKERGMR